MSNKKMSIAANDSNVKGYSPLMSPYHLKQELPLTGSAKMLIRQGRASIAGILRGEDSRKLLVVGQCSVYDPEEDMDYAAKLKELSDRVKDVFVVVKRTYFEKPRTTTGWKGLISEPRHDGKERINEGLYLARKLLSRNAEIGLLSGTEFLDPFVPQWTADLISWAAIGARTVQSAPHRQMASGLSMPVGFKNTTHGDTGAAIDAIVAAAQRQWFFGLDHYGIPSVVSTGGNRYTHVILRGGDSGPNYDSRSITAVQERLARKGLPPRLMVDCSHGNSGKDHTKQPLVFEDVIKQIRDGNRGIIGLMLESNINEGRQDLTSCGDTPAYGVSITDACIGWETTERCMMDAWKALSR